MGFCLHLLEYEMTIDDASKKIEEARAFQMRLATPLEEALALHSQHNKAYEEARAFQMRLTTPLEEALALRSQHNQELEDARESLMRYKQEFEDARAFQMRYDKELEEMRHNKEIEEARALYYQQSDKATINRLNSKNEQLEAALEAALETVQNKSRQKDLEIESLQAQLDRLEKSNKPDTPGGSPFWELD